MSGAPLRCILITPAHNEEAFIEHTLRSMVDQTVRPIRWVLVNDGSTDGTAAIIGRYAARHDWIDVVTMPPRQDRNFAAKVHGFNAGYQRVKALDHQIVGNIDADVSFDKDFLEFLLQQFRDDPRLAVAGTIFYENGYCSGTDTFDGQNHVSGQVQLFRRECFEAIGGYVPHKAGGIDWIAVTTARMLGWKTRSFREKSFFHHRSLGTADRHQLRSALDYGKKDYYLGGHPLWELFRVGYQMTQRPYYFLGGLFIGLGYALGYLRRMDRPVSNNLLRFHRQEQMRKLRAILKSTLMLRRIDKFRLMPN